MEGHGVRWYEEGGHYAGRGGAILVGGGMDHLLWTLCLDWVVGLLFSPLWAARSSRI